MAAATLAGAAAASDTAPALIRRKIPSSGEELPLIGLGTSGPFEVGASAAQRAPLREVLAAFFAAGARLIDTSPMYSTAQGVLGDLLTPQMQESGFLATKVWTRGESEGTEQMEHSARLLKRQRLDLIQVHNLQDLDTQLKTLRAWKESVVAKLLTMTECVPATVPVAAVAVTTLESELVADTVVNTPDASWRALRSVLNVNASASSRFNAVV